MAYWSEMRGITLRLGDAHGAARYIRLTLVERRGLLGAWHNVREARAERASEERGLPQALGEGRMLSWRPIVMREAEKLLSERTRTLERIGYCVIHSSEARREPWAWLGDLVHRQLHEAERSEAPDRSPLSSPATSGVDSLAREELSAAIASVDAQLSNSANEEPDDSASQAELDQRTDLAMLEGFAGLVGLTPERFAKPSLDDLPQVDLDALTPLLDQLVESPRPALRDVAVHWLELPALIYELDPAMVERWLEEGRVAARLIASRLPSEGLALCGESSLRRLQQRSRSPRIRQFAAKWVTRLDG